MSIIECESQVFLKILNQKKNDTTVKSLKEDPIMLQYSVRPWYDAT